MGDAILAQIARVTTSQMRDIGSLAVTISAGAAETVHAPQDSSAKDTMCRADQTLYAANAKGNRRTIIYKPINDLFERG